MESQNFNLKDGYDDVDGILPGLKKNGYQKIDLLASFKTNKMAPHSTITQQDVLKRQNLAVNPVEKIAKELAIDIVKYLTNNKPNVMYNKYAKTMRRTVDEVCERHDILFKGMMNRLHITPDSAKDTFREVIEELFSDNQINWGRIVVVYAFGGRLARYCVESHSGVDVDTIGQILGNYVSEHLGSWIHQNGGWVGINSIAPETCAKTHAFPQMRDIANASCDVRECISLMLR